MIKKKVIKRKKNVSSKIKTPVLKKRKTAGKVFKSVFSGDDLDVPGSELDDEMESVGSEDEENNYYSLGGDNHVENNGEF